MITIAIDGHAGAGKSTAAKALARALGLVYLDTGAMYRMMGLKALRQGADPGDEAAVLPMLESTRIEVVAEGGEQRFLLDGEDVSSAIRTAECGMAASAVSAIPAVREKLVALQQQIARGANVVMDGRDIGTVVLPNAKYKFFVTASPAVRAQRRYQELLEKGLPAKPVKELEAEIEKRDYDDSHRAHSPLRQAEDAEYIDTTGMSAQEVIDHMLRRVQEGEAGHDQIV